MRPAAYRLPNSPAAAIVPLGVEVGACDGEASAAERRWDLDALRGLLLVLMTLTHLPTRFSDPAGQPFGFVSAAEGFVMVSGFMAGLVYSAKARRDGEAQMHEAFFKRALKIYACQAGLLLFAFTVIAAIGMAAREEAVTNLLAFFFERPLTAVFSGLLLIYNPALLDILPIYILFMLVSPLILLHGLHHGWGGILAGSVLLWLAAQFDLGRALFEHFDLWLKLAVRYEEMGAFEVFGWQFLWVLGLWMGAAKDQPDAPPSAFPPWLVRGAIVYACICLVWRHVVGQTPFPGNAGLNLMFDKWHLGPLRLIDFMALMLLLMHYGPWLKRHLPRVAVLETLGRASLPVFCAHLVVALTALALFGAANPSRPWTLDVLILTVGFAVLYGVALVSQAVDDRAAALRPKLKARRATARDLKASGARPARASTAHSPPR